MTSVLVRRKEVVATPATLFTFWWSDVPVPEPSSTYQKTSMRNQFAWVAEVIATNSPTWARDGSEIQHQDLLPEAQV